MAAYESHQLEPMKKQPSSSNNTMKSENINPKVYLLKDSSCDTRIFNVDTLTQLSRSDNHLTSEEFAFHEAGLRQCAAAYLAQVPSIRVSAAVDVATLPIEFKEIAGDFRYEEPPGDNRLMKAGLRKTISLHRPCWPREFQQFTTFAGQAYFLLRVEPGASMREIIAQTRQALMAKKELFSAAVHHRSQEPDLMAVDLLIEARTRAGFSDTEIEKEIKSCPALPQRAKYPKADLQRFRRRARSHVQQVSNAYLAVLWEKTSIFLPGRSRPRNLQVMVAALKTIGIGR